MKRFLMVALLLYVVTVLAGVLSLKTAGAAASRQVSQARFNSPSCIGQFPKFGV